VSSFRGHTFAMFEDRRRRAAPKRAVWVAGRLKMWFDLLLRMIRSDYSICSLPPLPRM
jgi:hypothetical protein